MTYLNPFCCSLAASTVIPSTSAVFSNFRRSLSVSWLSSTPCIRSSCLFCRERMMYIVTAQQNAMICSAMQTPMAGR